MSRTSGRRGLLTMAILLALLLVVADLLRQDSLLVGAWHAMVRPEGTPLQRMMRRFGVH